MFIVLFFTVSAASWRNKVKYISQTQGRYQDHGPNERAERGPGQPSADHLEFGATDERTKTTKLPFSLC